MKIDARKLLRENGFRLFFTVAAVVVSIWAPVASAQTSDSPAAEDTRPITVSTNLITFNVSVTGIDGLAVSGLNKDNFNIFDNKIPQEIHFFSDADVPASISVVFDSSGSMSGGKIEQAKKALAGFIQTSKEQDEFFLIDFGSRANLLLDQTRDGDALLKKFTFVQPNGKTALYDAVALGLERVLQGSHPRKIVLLISDGQDNSSRTSFRQIKNRLQESNVIVYTIGVGGYFTSFQKGLSGKGVLTELAATSGGKSFFPNNSNEMDEALDRIALDIRRLYSIGYYPSDTAIDGKSHRITVKVKPSAESQRLFVYNRKEYVTVANP